MKKNGFVKRAEEILALPIAFRVNELGGYGVKGEIIYERHPRSCPSVLVENQGNVTATFMSNGSLDMIFKRDDGMEIRVLRGHPGSERERYRGLRGSALRERRPDLTVSAPAPPGGAGWPGGTSRGLDGSPHRDVSRSRPG